MTRVVTNSVVEGCVDIETDIVSIDFETHLWTPGNLAPRPVCVSAAQRPEGSDDLDVLLLSNADEGFRDFIASALYGDEILVGCNFPAFDLPVIATAFPEFIPQIFRALEDGRVHDVQIREKLINLSTNGRLEYVPLPDGSVMYQTYSLLELEKLRLGIDRTEAKENEDAWRNHYRMLDGIPTKDWPDEAIVYPKDDARNTLLIWEDQERDVAEGRGSVVTQELHAMAAFALKLMTCWGMMIDFDKKREIEAILERELAPEKLDLLIKTGILTPAQPEQPLVRRNKAGDVVPVFDKATGLPKIKRATKEKVSRTVLTQIVAKVSAENDVEVKPTPKGGISTDAEVLETLAPLNKTLAQYKHRQDLQKLVTTELPRMSGSIIHFFFDPLKETGRTSSRAEDGIPSANGQNIDPRVRPAYVPRPGCLLCSVDFSSMELVTAAYTCHKHLGYSVLRDIINADIDPHAHLGAQIAFEVHPDFAEICTERNMNDRDQIFEVFAEFKKHENAEVRGFFKNNRTLAKPTGLGYWGGLGADTFVSYAKGGYGINLTREQAEHLREIWFATYPEAREYLQEFVPHVLASGNDEYTYTSPLGMVRAGASFCAAANGFALQTPGAEGAKLAAYEVTKACYDESQGSILLGCHTVNFPHDELIVEIPDDEQAHERAYEIARIMVEAFSRVITGMKVKATPVLMRRWWKEAEPRFDENKRLIPWEPEVAA